MSDKPSSEETALWQRRLAGQANNTAWRLSEQAARTTEEDDEMLNAAHAALHLWRIVGNARNLAHARLLLAQVHALVGNADRAAHDWAKASPILFGAEAEPWETAIAHSVAANVAWVRGDASAHLDHYETAARLIDALPDAEDREILRATFRGVPVPLSSHAA